jgi:hypothetical protein
MGVVMPWFPEFTSAVELARTQTRAAGQADPVGQYFTALNEGDTHALETVWPGEVVIYDPRAGEIRGHKQLRRFVSQNQSWLAEHHARIETVASTVAGGRAVVELSAGGGIGLQHCAVTDDGVRCALEYNCVRWGSHDLPPQAGIGVYERGPDGLLAAARVYDDVEAPVGQP